MLELIRKDVILKERQFREMSVGMVNTESRTISCAFSSEMPYARWWGVEVLDHSMGACDLTRLNDAAPLLYNHDPDEQIGVVETSVIDPDKIGRANIRFSSTDGEKYFQDVKDGIRKKISVGYQILDMIQLNDEQLTPQMIAAQTEPEMPIWKVTKWQPMEVSLVSIPADSSVGIGRGADQETNVQKIPIKGVVMDAIVKEKTPEELKSEQERAERERIAEIEAVAAKYSTRIPNMDALKRDAVDLKQSVELFRGHIFLKVTDDKPLEGIEIGMSEKEKKQFSIRKLILSFDPQSKEKAEFERECSDQVAAKLQRPPKGAYIPYDIQIHPMSEEQRAMIAAQQRSVLIVGTSTLGGNLVGTQIRPESFIELLRNRMLMLKLGVQELPGLQQNVAIPKQSAAIVGGWVAENAAPTQSNPTFAQVTLSPKTFAAFTDYSRQLLLQSTPGVDGLVINDIARVQAIAIDKGILNGTGSAGQPTGITATAGLTTNVITTFTWAMAVQFETDVTTANADVATMSYVTTPAVRGSLKGKVKVAGYPQFMIENDGLNMNGYPVYPTNQAASATVLFGDWSQTILGEFGTLDILVDPYTGSSAGTIRVTSFQSVDVGVRQIGAYSYGTTFS